MSISAVKSVSVDVPQGRFKPYPKYKDSGVEWLGKVPDGWNIKRLQWLYQRKRETGFPEAELLSVYRDYGVIPKASRDDNFNNPSEDLSGYQLVRKNDLVLNKMKTWQGSIAVSEYEGIVSPAYFVAFPKSEFVHKYIHYLVRSLPYIAEYRKLSTGVRPNQWDLDYDYFKLIPALLPSPEEQQAIAIFIDRETTRVDELIKKQQRLMALLKEKREAIISYVVTKGLDTKVTMKDSGIPWLDKIPKHWELKRLKYVSKSVQTGSTPKGGSDTDGWSDTGLDWFTPGDFGEDIWLSEASRKIDSVVEEEQSMRIFPANSIFIIGIGGTLGKVGIIRKAASANQQINAVIPDSNIEPLFLAYTLSVKADVMQMVSNASTIGIMNQEKTKQIIIPLPDIEEQKEIIRFIGDQVPLIDNAIQKSQSALLLLQEHRTALITAAVTGKIDVRQAA